MSISEISASPAPTLGERDGLWAVVLAGGDGARLRAFARGVLDDQRPKLYLPLVGTRSLLGQTLHRAGLLIPAERTVVISQESHRPYLRTQATQGATLLLQPENKDTAPGVLLPGSGRPGCPAD